MVEVHATQGTVQTVTCAVKGGLRDVTTARIVDATGDADVVVAAGAEFRQGHSGTGKMQPVSMLLRCFRTDNARIADQIADSEPTMAKRPDFADPFPVDFNGLFSRRNDIVLAEGLFPNRDLGPVEGDNPTAVDRLWR